MLFSEPKIPQSADDIGGGEYYVCFSALQRAENSSIRVEQPADNHSFMFQCSSASRKFLNIHRIQHPLARLTRFSALQRAENSSITAGVGRDDGVSQVSVLFSEPKIPQLRRCVLRCA